MPAIAGSRRSSSSEQGGIDFLALRMSCRSAPSHWRRWPCIMMRTLGFNPRLARTDDGGPAGLCNARYHHRQQYGRGESAWCRASGSARSRANPALMISCCAASARRRCRRNRARRCLALRLLETDAARSNQILPRMASLPTPDRSAPTRYAWRSTPAPKWCLTRPRSLDPSLFVDADDASTWGGHSDDYDLASQQATVAGHLLANAPARLTARLFRRSGGQGCRDGHWRGSKLSLRRCRGADGAVTIGKVDGSRRARRSA